jgi:hypothetical protein
VEEVSVFDTISFTEQVTIFTDAQASVFDTLSFTEQVTTFTCVPASVFDTTSFTEQVTTFTDARSSVLDTVSFTEEVSLNTSPFHTALSPLNEAVFSETRRPVFRFTATDPDGDDICYEVEITTSPP